MEDISIFFSGLAWWGWLLIVFGLIAIRDVIQKKHTISHNFPIFGHLRYLLEKIGPELRQYIVANNREELPFNRSKRSWVYASSKSANNYQGFGTDQDQSAPGYIFINPTMIPYAVSKSHPNTKSPDLIPSAKIMGDYNGRKRPYRPKSIVNISAMSFGSLSAKAIESLNRGAKKAGCYHNTGEGSLSKHHQHGADVIFQIGTGYFGVRDDNGSFSMDKMKALVDKHAYIRAIEIKLSQGAKPGKGGVLPASKITKEIAGIRGIPMNKDVVSPSRHTVFSDIPGLLNFIDDMAQETGLPVGFKSAVGKMDMWEELTHLMVKTGKGPDFISIDGGEGGTGAAPPSFANHVSLPFIYGFSQVYQIFAKKNLTDRVVFIAAGKLGFPSSALMALSMGADIINVAREAMLSIGCIQAQTCHTNNCPAGIATQNKWLQAGINTTLKSERFYQYVKTLRKEIVQITHACGYEHPSQMTMEDVDMSMGDNNYTTNLRQIFNYDKTEVPFKGVEKLINCPHLGGAPLKN